MFNLEEQGGEGKAVGWISMADMFMLCSILMLAVAVGYAMSLKRTDQLLTSVQGDYASYKNSSTATIDDLTGKSAQLSSAVGAARTQAADLDQQAALLRSQLAETQRQRASFKTEGEALARDVAAHLAKLSSLQSEFDTYRTTNTKTTGDLNVALLRSAKALEDSKNNESGLRLQLSTLEGKLALSEKLATGLTLEGAKSKSTGEELARQKLKLEGELATLTSELSKVRGELTNAGAAASRMNAEKEDLLATLNSWKATSGIFQKEKSDLQKQLSIVQGDKTRAETKLTDLESTIIGLNSDIGELKPQLTKLKVDLSGANLRIVDLEKAVFEKINRAKLIVTVTAENVPKDFTLELFVTDPLSNECGPFSSVIFNEGDEIGFLQQSVDFKTGMEGSQKAVFYSMRPVYSRMESGLYTVKAMIRHNGNDPRARLANPITVNCSIEVPGAAGPDTRKVAQLQITSAGYIKKTKRNSALSSQTPYKHMWPWEPVSHNERFICDFRVSNERITDFRTFDKLPIEPGSPTMGADNRGDEKAIDSIRNRGGN